MGDLLFIAAFPPVHRCFFHLWTERQGGNCNPVPVEKHRQKLSVRPIHLVYVVEALKAGLNTPTRRQALRPKPKNVTPFSIHLDFFILHGALAWSTNNDALTPTPL